VPAPAKLTVVRPCPAALCPYCGEVATVVCTHPISFPRIVFPADVETSDFLLSVFGDGFYEVLGVAIEDFNGTDQSTRYFFSLLEKGRLVRRSYTAHMPTLVMEMGRCGRRVCERHVREFDDDSLQCAEHWPDMDQVYSVE
jgi:hypothetical protein